MKALITGASSGIGASFAYALAKRGIDLVLVARSSDKLNKIKKDLKVNVEVISMDLLDIKNVYKLHDLVKDIDILINNAGFGLFGLFESTSLDRELEMIDLNIKTVHILTKLYLSDFLKKDKGYILNVASCAGFASGPRLSTYYATKNYVLKLTMAINEELRHDNSNVYIGALCPGPVNTNFNKTAHGEFSIKEISPDYVARYALDKMFQRKMLIIPTFKMKLVIFLNRFAPYRLSLNIAYHIQGKKLGK